MLNGINSNKAMDEFLVRKPPPLALERRGKKEFVGLDLFPKIHFL